MKRSYAASQLDDGSSTRQKRSRAANAVTLTDEPTERRQETTPFVDDGDADAGSDGAVGEDDDSESGRPRTLTVLEQLRHDAFCDLKDELRLELDCLRKPPARGAPDEGTQNVCAVLQRWLEQDAESRPTNQLYYRLDSTYPDKDFPPEVFAGRDEAVVETLSQAVYQVDVEVFFVLLERENAESPPSYLASTVADLQGQKVLSHVPVDEQNWLQTRLPSLKARPPRFEAVSAVPPGPLLKASPRLARAHVQPTLGGLAGSAGQRVGLCRAVLLAPCRSHRFGLSSALGCRMVS